MKLNDTLHTKLELLVDFGPSPDEAVVSRTLEELKTNSEVKDAVFKDGAIVVETTLPSSVVVDMVAKVSQKRTVLQGFGDSQSAVAMVSNQECCASGPIMGIIRFHQQNGMLVADGTIDGLRGTHGLHIHETGDLSEGCKSIGGHYNPNGGIHGPQNAEIPLRHAGDLGNIRADENGRATFRIVDGVLKVWDIIGRSVAITERPDDLGQGDSPSSKVDGNSGETIACGIIARSAGIFENPKRVCLCDGVVVWDERDKPLAGKRRRQSACCKRETEHVENSNRCCK